MAGLKIKVKFDKLKNLKLALEKLGDEKTRNICKQVNDELAQRGLEKLYNETPVDSGQLRQGWRATTRGTNGKSYQVSYINNTSYASHVEMGWSQEPPFKEPVTGRKHIGMYVKAIDAQLVRPYIDGLHFTENAMNEFRLELPDIINGKVEEILKRELGL